MDPVAFVATAAVSIAGYNAAGAWYQLPLCPRRREAPRLDEFFVHGAEYLMCYCLASRPTVTILLPGYFSPANSTKLLIVLSQPITDLLNVERMR